MPGGRKRGRGSESATRSRVEDSKLDSEREGIGRSRGGLTSKVVGICDARARLLSCTVLPGNRHDLLGVADCLDDLIRAPKHLLGDLGFDAKEVRRAIVAIGSNPVIPSKRNAKHPVVVPDWLYRHRNLIERLWAKLKEWRGIATRYEKKKANWRAVVVLGGIMDWVKSLIRK